MSHDLRHENSGRAVSDADDERAHRYVEMIRPHLRQRHADGARRVLMMFEQELIEEQKRPCGPETPLAMLKLSNSTVEKLDRIGVITVEQYQSKTDEWLMRHFGVGEKTLEEVDMAIQEAFGGK